MMAIMFDDQGTLIVILVLIIVGIGIAGIVVICNSAENDDDAGYTL